MFVSFQSGQREQAEKLVRFLEAAGHACWHMNRNIRSGHDWPAEIQEGIDWCTDLVLLFGPESDASKHVRREVNLADSDDKTIHWLRLADVQPVNLRLLLSLVNGIDWFNQDVAPHRLLEDLAPQLRRSIVQRDDDHTDFDPDSTEVVTLFVNRFSERDALRQSLEAHIRETTQEAAPSQVNNNLLTFYGIGGQGKSRLSRRLERWIKGALPADDHWGAPPRTALTARWNLDQSHDRPQLLSFLAAFRRMLARTGHTFPEFDVAFAAFYIKAAGDISGDAALKSLDEELLDVVGDLARQVGVTGSSDVLTLTRLRRLLAVDREQDIPILQRPDALGQLLGLIGDRGDSLDSWPLIVAGAMDAVTRRLRQLNAEERPTIAVFVDTFEAIQSPERLVSEQVINALIAHLPLCLFVVTGRERVTWHEPDCRHVRWAGPQRWPSLTRTAPEDDEPRQHELVTLSLLDTEDALRHALADVDWQLSARELARLAAETQGWPLHVEILVNLIRERRATSASGELTFEDLLGSFPALVRRLLQHLPNDVQLALQAAAVAPSFDAASLRLCDRAIKAGTITRLLRTSLVGRSEDPFFPYKLHDELRHAVASAGSSVPGGWEDEDRVVAAEQLVAGLELRLREAKLATAHVEMMHVHGMAVRLCLQYGLEVEWVKKAFLSVPSHKYQRDLMPNVDRVRSDSELLGLVQVYRALGLEDRRARLNQLQRISTHAHSDRVRFRADLWTMYAVRNMDPAAAVELSRELLGDPYDRNCGEWPKPHNLMHQQHASTLATAGRWDQLQEFDPTRSLNAWSIVDRAHGCFADAAARSRRRLEDHRAKKKSYRFAMELVDDTLQREVFAGQGLRLVEFLELAEWARRFDIEWARMRVSATVGPWLVGEQGGSLPHLWNELCEQRQLLQTNSSRRSRATFAISVAMAGGDRAFAEEVQQEYIREGGCSPVEAPLSFLYEYIGLPIPIPELPWLENIDVVRQRWLEGWQHTLVRPPGWEYSEDLYG